MNRTFRLYYLLGKVSISKIGSIMNMNTILFSRLKLSMKNREAVKNLKFTSESVPYSQSICTFVAVISLAMYYKDLMEPI